MLSTSAPSGQHSRRRGTTGTQRTDTSPDGSSASTERSNLSKPSSASHSRPPSTASHPAAPEPAFLGSGRAPADHPAALATASLELGSARPPPAAAALATASLEISSLCDPGAALARVLQQAALPDPAGPERVLHST
jgi:hypothetical protein